MLADLLLNCTLSNITVTALSSSLSTSPYRTGILSTAAPKKGVLKRVLTVLRKGINALAKPERCFGSLKNHVGDDNCFFLLICMWLTFECYI